MERYSDGGDVWSGRFPGGEAAEMSIKGSVKDEAEPAARRVTCVCTQGPHLERTPAWLNALMSSS